MKAASLKIILRKLYWFAWERSTAILDATLYFISFPVKGARLAANNKKTIVYVGEFLPPRIPRMVKWLKRGNDYRVVLLCNRHGYIPAFSNSSIDHTLLFRNHWHLRRILRSLPPIWLMHSFAPKSYFPDVARLALPEVPFIHDMQDVYATYYGITPVTRWLKHELPHEKNCLAFADGVISHSMEMNEGYRRYHLTKKPASLFFPLYCDDDHFSPGTKKISDTEIHLAYAGGVAGSHRDAKHYGNIQFHGLIKKLTAQGLHFHIYPSPSNIRPDYEEYEIIAKENPRFHFHKPVDQDKLAEELSRYHYGMLPFFRELSDQSDLKLKYATTLKLFNYLEAGLPILVSKDLGFQSWLVERYSGGIGIQLGDLSELGTLLKEHDYAQLQKNVLLTREKLSLKKNISRLEKFYSQITAPKVS